MSNRTSTGLAGRLALCDILAVDAAAQYRQLLQLGREAFLAAAAPAVLVCYRVTGEDPAASAAATLSIDEEIEDTLPRTSDAAPEKLEYRVYPLIKKPGASFPDRITIGRTTNNDIVIADSSVSRLHAYVRRDGSKWVVADAGSKNGSWLLGVKLTARRERPLSSRGVIRLGDVELTFYVADDLFTALGGRSA